MDISRIRPSLFPIIVFQKNYTIAPIYYEPGILGHIGDSDYQVKCDKIIDCKQNGDFINIWMTMEKDICYQDKSHGGITNYMTLIYVEELFSSKLTAPF